MSWHAGRFHRTLTSVSPGAAAERAALLKHTKYAAIKATHKSVPVAIETLGPINEEGTSFLCEIGERLKVVSGDPRERAFLFHRVSVIVQRANAIAFHGTFDIEESNDWRLTPLFVHEIVISWLIFIFPGNKVPG